MRLILLSLILFLTACPEKGLNVKVYSSQPEYGAVRLQEHEIVPYSETKGWIMLNEKDAEALLNYCLNPDSK